LKKVRRAELIQNEMAKLDSRNKPKEDAGT